MPLIDQHTQSLTRSLRDSKSMGTLQKLQQPTGHLGFNFIYRMDGIKFFFLLEKDKQLACTHAVLVLLLPRQYGNAEPRESHGCTHGDENDVSFISDPAR